MVVQRYYFILLLLLLLLVVSVHLPVQYRHHAQGTVTNKTAKKTEDKTRQQKTAVQ